MSQVWLKRHLRGLSICGVFPLLRSFKAFKRFCILAMSSPLKHPTFAGSKRALASHGTVFYLCHLSLSLNNPISLRSNERHERPCCCFDKYFKIASRLLPHFSNLFETTRAICRGFKTSALLWTNPLTKYFLFLLDQKLLECSSCLTLESL